MLYTVNTVSAGVETAERRNGYKKVAAKKHDIEIHLVTERKLFTALT